MSKKTCVEICAGGGGSALGLEQAGFSHLALIERSRDACATLRLNRPGWPVIQADVRELDGRPYRGVDLLSGGVPCTPFSGAGQQLGAADERDLFPEALRLAAEIGPRAILLENADTLMGAKFTGYRDQVTGRLLELGYAAGWRVIDCAGHGVNQRRRRTLLVAMRPGYMLAFRPPPAARPPLAAGDALHDLMAARGWPGADDWRDGALEIAPTLAGGSEKHGGADLGPSGAKRAWARLGVNGLGIADEAPDAAGMQRRGSGLRRAVDGAGPMLTVPMGARLQGFPDGWRFAGGKTAQWGQVGNAFPAAGRAGVRAGHSRRAGRAGIDRSARVYGELGCRASSIRSRRRRSHMRRWAYPAPLTAHAMARH